MASIYVTHHVIIPTIAVVGLLLNAAQLVLQGRPRIILRHQVSVYLTALSAAIAVRFLAMMLETLTFAVSTHHDGYGARVVCRGYTFLYVVTTSVALGETQ